MTARLPMRLTCTAAAMPPDVPPKTQTSDSMISAPAGGMEKQMRATDTRMLAMFILNAAFAIGGGNFNHEWTQRGRAATK